MNRGLTLLFCAVAVAATVSSTAVADTDISLNLRYTHPADVSLGGTWTAVAKTGDANGIAGISFVIDNIDLGSVAMGPDINADLDPFAKPDGTVVNVVYGQDPSETPVVSPMVSGVGTGAGSAGNQPLDPLDDTNTAGPTTWDDVAVIATGTFSGPRPAFVSNPNFGGDTAANDLNATADAGVEATIGLLVVRGDSVASQGEGDVLPLGDTDRDFDVDTADITAAIGGFTGAGVPIPFPVDEHWMRGDFDADTDNDTADITVAIGGFTGALPGGASGQPVLDYDHATGNVILFPNDVNILSFNIQSENRFSPPADFSALESSTFGVPGLSDNLPGSIGWVSAIAAGGNGFGDTPEDQAGASLGNIFPTGLTEDEVQHLLTNNAWATSQGGSGQFVLTGGIVPEPSTLLLFAVAGMGLIAQRRRG